MLYLIVTRYLFDPLAWALYLLIAALIADHHGRHGLKRGLVAGAALFLFALMILPFDQLLARPLEDRYPRPPLPAHVDGIVILEGGYAQGVFATRHVAGQDTTELRLVAGADLARRFPKAKLVFSGIASTRPLLRQQERDAMAGFLATLGIAPGRTIFETRSRDTGENLADVRKLVRAGNGETWMLVTSAVHMPRAMAVAQRLGWKMVPWPSDYISPAGSGAAIRIAYPSTGLMGIDAALHEWIGLAAYRLTGRAG